MSIPKRVLSIVARSMKGVCLCKNVLVVTPTEHIMRGFFIDRTAHKNKYNLWKVVVPLYRPMHLLILNYSKQIQGPNWLTIERDQIPVAAQRVTEYILDGHLDHLKRLRSPKEFLEHISWMIGNDTDHFLFDYAVTQYMLGNHAACLASLETINHRNESAKMPRPNIFTCAKEFIPKLRTSPCEVAEVLEQLEKTNVTQFALEPTMIRPRLQIVAPH